jgi:cytochrome c oxidase assembly protein subunit 15
MSASVAPTHNPSLHRFAVFSALATLGLVGIGGLVTSHGAGMAVPDWPNTYGYNMFFFPVSQWVGGIFYEHTHRLVASGVGLLTVVLALWLYGRSARPFMRWTGAVLVLLGAGTALALPRRWADGSVLGFVGLALLGASWVWPRCEASAQWLRRLGVAAFFAVVLQGVLGGLRVVLFKDALGIFHATLAQLFFVLLCAIALFTSRWWQAARLGRGFPWCDRSAAFRLQNSGIEERVGISPEPQPGPALLQPEGCAPMLPRALNSRLSTLYLLSTLLILAQLTLGAAMRHQHAGLAIPDFPLAYGKLWPAMDAGSVASYNQQRIEVVAANPITAVQIGLQMIHRLLAMTILAAVAYAARSTWRALRGKNLLSRLALVWLGVILTQVVLGAATIWSNKAADIATAHVLVGALSLALGAILSIVSYRELMLAYRETDLSTVTDARTMPKLNPLLSGASGPL